MPVPAPELEVVDGIVRARGAWQLAQAPRLEKLLAQSGLPKRLDASGLTALDTSAALLLARRFVDIDGLRPEWADLLRMVRAHDAPRREVRRARFSVLLMLERMGEALVRAFAQLLLLLDFAGQVVLSGVAMLRGRQRLRLVAVVHHMERNGLDAVPIVAMLSFLVGAVVAFLGATVLQDFGAALYTVELVSFSFQREFAVLLAAILVAGRSGSAFAAEIGTMRAREEIDAIAALAMRPIELLVWPRLLALVLVLPALTVVGCLSGILGGALVGSLALDISPAMFVTRMQDVSELRHFFVGIVKAPVFALMIGLVGCLEGLKVRGSAESVGRHTTAAVVQSIFLVILCDALFAVFFMELGW